MNKIFHLLNKHTLIYVRLVALALLMMVGNLNAGLANYDPNDYYTRFVVDKDFVSVIEFDGDFNQRRPNGESNAEARASNLLGQP